MEGHQPYQISPMQLGQIKNISGSSYTLKKLGKVGRKLFFSCSVHCTYLLLNVSNKTKAAIKEYNVEDTTLF